MSKAFDRVGDDHLRNTFNSLPLPTNLTKLVTSLATTNSTKLKINKVSSNQIKLHCGFAQGSPLSPTIFNARQDYAVKQISDTDISNTYGYELSAELTKVVALAFADDTVVIAKDANSACALIESLSTEFAQSSA